MRTDLALCRHLAGAAAGMAPFTLAPEEILEFDGGPVEAVVRCRLCAGCGWLHRVERDPRQRLSVYALAALRPEDAALYFRNVARGSCDAGRARAEREALAACTGPFERLVTLRADTLALVAVAAHPQARHD